MDNQEVNNISALFKKPMPIKPALNLQKSITAAPSLSNGPAINKVYSHSEHSTPQQAKSETSNPVKKDFSLVDFSGGKGMVKGDSLSDKTFRYKTQQALKGTLKRFADRQVVADLLWNKRGYGGITRDEVKFGLRKLEKQGKLRRDQVRAVRRKMGM